MFRTNKWLRGTEMPSLDDMTDPWPVCRAKARTDWTLLTFATRTDKVVEFQLHTDSTYKDKMINSGSLAEKVMSDQLIFLCIL